VRGHAGGVQRTPCLANLLQPVFAPSQFRRQFITALIPAMLTVFGRVRRLSLLQQFGDLRWQTQLSGRHAVVTHRAV